MCDTSPDSLCSLSDADVTMLSHAHSNDISMIVTHFLDDERLPVQQYLPMPPIDILPSVWMQEVLDVYVKQYSSSSLTAFITSTTLERL